MSVYRYFSTDLLTGALRADTIPLHVSSLSRALGGVGQPGTLSGYLDLGTINAGKQSAYLAALEPRKTVLWVMQDNYPIWAGIIWNWNHQSAVSNQLPVEATEFGSLFNRRQIRVDQTYVGQDLFTIARNLITYATGKTHGAISGLVLGSTTAGATTSATFPATNLQKVGDALNALATQSNFEYAFTPALDSSANPVINLQLGYPTLGRAATATNLLLQYPGNVSDYSYPRMGASSVNSLLATASAGAPWASGTTHGQNAADFTAGYPLLEDSVSLTAAAVTTQAQIDAYADGQLPRLTGTTTVPSVSVAGGKLPTAGMVQLGDQAYFAATSTLHPANTDGSPGLQTTLRIIGWTVTPPSDANQNTESTAFALGGLTT